MRTLITLAFLAVCSTASANPWGIKLNPGETLISVNGVPVSQHYRAPKRSAPRPKRAVSTYQQRAQDEANYMARHGIKGHVWGVIGRFEGVGWATHSNPPTCTPRRGMRLVADAKARGRDGWYRVRAWL